MKTMARATASRALAKAMRESYLVPPRVPQQEGDLFFTESHFPDMEIDVGTLDPDCCESSDSLDMTAWDAVYRLEAETRKLAVAWVNQGQMRRYAALRSRWEAEKLYGNRLAELKMTAGKDGISIKPDSVSDFWSFVRKIPFARRGYLTATLAGGLNLFWRKHRIRISIHFLGNGELRFVILSPHHPPIEDQATVRQAVPQEILDHRECLS